MAGYEELYGLEVLAADPDGARGRVPVRDSVRQPAGLVHGGIYASIAESLATAATEAGLDGAVVTGQSSQTSFLRPITEGAVHAAGRPRHRGRSTWVWEFDITDDAERLCALVRMTVAVRYPR
jgi:1,4-dihydroxy-2-naphthoyl-CoA hydrolase